MRVSDTGRFVGRVIRFQIGLDEPIFLSVIVRFR